MKKGNLSINSENILPIIKKWLYSDSDIFIRELVSNGCDAINKLKKLATMGEATLKENEKFSIRVVLDKENKTQNVYLFVNLATKKVDYLTLIDCQELGFDINIDRNRKWFEV